MRDSVLACTVSTDLMHALPRVSASFCRPQARSHFPLRWLCLFINHRTGCRAPNLAMRRLVVTHCELELVDDGESCFVIKHQTNKCWHNHLNLSFLSPEYMSLFFFPLPCSLCRHVPKFSLSEKCKIYFSYL